MSESSHEVIAVIDALPSVDGLDDIYRLHVLVDRYFALPSPAEHLDVWFRLYERFPETDPNWASWRIVHHIEFQPGYERFVVASVRHKPSLFSVMMVSRLLNGGISSAADVDLLDLLRAVSSDEHCSPSVRRDAEGSLEYQRWVSSLDGTEGTGGAVHAKVMITRYVSHDPQPGLVECQLVDAHGRCWSFVDKNGIFNADDLDAGSPYPLPGVIAGEVIGRVRDAAGREVIQIDTEWPWGLESVEGATRFEVLAEALVEE
jgi:hypothetical protein